MNPHLSDSNISGYLPAFPAPRTTGFQKRTVEASGRKDRETVLEVASLPLSPGSDFPALGPR